jgi:WD40 repeat protein
MSANGQFKSNNLPLTSKNNQTILFDKDTMLLGMGELGCMAMSPDGKYLATGGGSGRIYIWDIKTCKLITALIGHTGYINSLAFNPDNKTLGSGSNDKTIKIWDVQNETLLKTLYGHTDEVQSVCFNPTGDKIASGSNDETIKLWDVQSGNILNTFQGHKDGVSCLSFNPQGDKIASGSYDCTIKLWDINNGKNIKTFIGHNYPIFSLAFNPDGTKLASSSTYETIILWDVNSGNIISTIRTNYFAVSSCAFSPDGKILAFGCDSINFWNVNKGENLKILKGYPGGNNMVLFSPTGDTLISGGGDNIIKFWDTKSGNVINTMTGHSFAVNSLAFRTHGGMIADKNPNNPLNYDNINFAIGNRDSVIRLWDINTGNVIDTLIGHSNQINSIAFNPIGTILASSSTDSTIKIWDMNLKKIKNTISSHTGTVTFSPDGSMLASGCGNWDGTIKLWDVNSFSLLRTLKEDFINTIYSVVFNPKDETIANTCGDDTIMVRNINGDKLISIADGYNFAEIENIAYNPDGSVLASCDFYIQTESGSIKFWDASNGYNLKTIPLNSIGPNAIAWHPNGKIIAVSVSIKDSIKYNYVYYHNIFLIDAFSGKIIKTLIGHTFYINSLAFSPDGNYLASGGGDGLCIIWNLQKILGIEDNKIQNNNQNISIYPNPASNSLKVQFNEIYTEPITISIFNSLGVEVYSNVYNDVSSGSININTGEMPSGTYFCRFVSGKKAETKKFIVIK